MQRILLLLFSLLVFGVNGYKLFYQQAAGFFDDPGVGWHLESARYLLEHYNFLTIDPFLQSQSPRTWISDQWLSEILLFKVLSILNWKGTYIAGCLSYLLLHFGIITFFLRRFSTAAVLTGSFFSFTLGLVHFLFRPVFFSFFFFTICYLCLLAIVHRVRREEGISQTKAYVGFALLFLLWAQIHPSFVLGIALTACALLSLVFEKMLMKQSYPSSMTNFVGFLLLICSASTLLNPYGIELHRSILALKQSEYFMKLNSEWLPLSIGSTEGGIFVMAVSIVLLFLFFASSRLPKIGVFETFLFFLFGFLSLKSERFLPYFGIVSAYPIALAVHCGLVELKKRLDLRSQGSGVESVAFAPGILLMVLLLAGVPIGSLQNPVESFEPARKLFPYHSVALLNEQLDAKESPAVILSHPNWGGFLTWKGQGKVKALIDDRNTLLGEEFYKEILGAFQESEKLSSVLQKYKPAFLLFPKQFSRDATFLREKLLSTGSHEILYEDEIELLIKLG